MNVRLRSEGGAIAAQRVGAQRVPPTPDGAPTTDHPKQPLFAESLDYTEGVSC